MTKPRMRSHQDLIRVVGIAAALVVPCLAVGGCSREPYDYAAHHQDSPATGSRLDGTQTGAEQNANTTNNPTINANRVGGARN